MAELLSIEHFSVRYGGRIALDDASVAIGEGERVAVVGANGAGKSTLLRAFIPDAGSCSGCPPCAFVPQETPEPPALSGWDYVMLGRTPHLSPWRRAGSEDRHAVEEALAMTGAEAFASRRLDCLSGGERRRLALAQALATGAPALLLDEPAAHLDFRQRSSFHALLERIDRTIVCVTHDFAWVRSGFFTRAILLARGRIAADGVPAEVLSKLEFGE